MKAIAHILGSYLHRRFFVWILLAGAIVLFVEASIILLVWRTPLRLFQAAFAYVALTIGSHLRQTVDGNAADLLPNHRRWQLWTAGLILTVFLFPTLIAGYVADALLTTLVVGLFLACLALWTSFFTFSRYGHLALIGWLVLLWLMFSSFDENSPVARLGHDYLGSFWTAYIIAASMLGFFYFAFRYLRMPYDSDAEKNDYWECLKTQDVVILMGVRFAVKAISRLARMKACRRDSFSRLIRLFQFSIFSPMYGGGLYRFGFVILVTYLSFHDENKTLAMNSILPAAYYWITAGLTANFLGHRSRMPFIYLSSCLPSRRSFIRATDTISEEIAMVEP